MRYCLAIDGGGTKTEGVLADRSGRVHGRCVAGPSNPNDTSVPQAAEVIARLVRELMRSASEQDGRFVLFAGISGALNHRAELEACLRSKLPTVDAVEVSSDVHILLSAELPSGDGACMICGTGSACFLRCGGAIHRIGGWGYLLDNGGSGYDMGRDALEAVLRAHDGRGEGTILTELLGERLGAPVWDRVTAIYEGGKPLIASFAPLVFDAARQQDPVADAILERNARALAEYIEAAYRLMQEKAPTVYETPFCVVMGGGISQKQAPEWMGKVASQVDSRIPLAVSVASKPAVLGALLEALRLGGHEFDRRAVLQSFAETYPMYL